MRPTHSGTGSAATPVSAACVGRYLPKCRARARRFFTQLPAAVAPVWGSRVSRSCATPPLSSAPLRGYTWPWPAPRGKQDERFKRHPPQDSNLVRRRSHWKNNQWKGAVRASNVLHTQSALFIKAVAWGSRRSSVCVQKEPTWEKFLLVPYEKLHVADSHNHIDNTPFVSYMVGLLYWRN